MSNITLPDLPSLEGGVFFHFIFLTFPIIETSVSDPDLHRSALSDSSRNKTGSSRKKKQPEEVIFFLHVAITFIGHLLKKICLV